MNLIPIVYIAIIILYCAGYFVSRIFSIENNNIFQTIWIGIFILGLSTFAVNIFLPLSGIGAFIAIAPAILSILFFYKEIQKALFQMERTTVIFLLIIPILALWYSIISNISYAYDTDLYHLQIVSWAREFPAVYGLGNVHSRLANSSVWYTLAALFPETLSAYTPTLMSAIFICTALGWFSIMLHSAKKVWERSFFIVLIPLLFFDIFLSNSNLYADYIALFVCLMASYHLLVIILEEEGSRDKSVKLALLYLALSFSIKPLASISIIFGIVILLWVWHRNVISFPTILVALILPLLMGGMWCVRNIILSGYPIYPLAFFPFSVDWLMPLEFVDGNRNAVMGWARWPHAGYTEALTAGISYWFPSWLIMNLSKKTFVITVLMPLLFGLFVWLYVFIKKYSHTALFFFIFSISNIAYWFFIAPEQRFGREYFWLFLALSFVFATRHNPSNMIVYLTKKINYSASLSLFIVCFLGLIISCGNFMPMLASSWHVLPVKEGRLLSEDPKIFLSVPVTGDQCGRAPIPCAPSDVLGLELREKNNLTAGFRIVK